MSALPVIGTDPGPMARFEYVKVQESTPSVVFQRLCEGETLREIASAWQVPKGLFIQWFMEEHRDLFDAAERVLAQDLKVDALKEADSATNEDIKPRTLRVKTRLELLPLMDRSRYGGKEDRSGTGITVVVDRSCGGAIAIQSGDTKVLVGPQERVISNEEGVI